MKILYIFPQRIYNKYYACNFTKALPLLEIHYHYCHHLNVQVMEVLLSQKAILTAAEKNKHHYQNV